MFSRKYIKEQLSLLENRRDMYSDHPGQATTIEDMDEFREMLMSIDGVLDTMISHHGESDMFGGVIVDKNREDEMWKVIDKTLLPYRYYAYSDSTFARSDRDSFEQDYSEELERTVFDPSKHSYIFWEYQDRTSTK